jgi:hypothetical protein
MKHDTYFWSCHISKEKLRQLGATDIHPAKFSYQYTFEPAADKDGKEFIFRAEPHFETVVKFACDVNIVKVSFKNHRSISKGRYPKIAPVSKLNNAVCLLKWNRLEIDK